MSYPFESTDKTTYKFTHTTMIKHLRQSFESLPDYRSGTGTYKKYSVLDAAMSAFSVFFMQSSSFLAHQKTMKKQQGGNNAESLFGVHQIPSDNQIRNLLDGATPNALHPLYRDIFKGLEQSGKLKEFHVLNGSTLIAMDGVEYFSSQKIHCNCCSTKTLKNGKTQYFHTAVTPVIVSPNQSSVIPLSPEFVTPQDGSEKQDYELAASKRWIERESSYQPVNTTILGDDLYCHQPFCEHIRDKGWNFILVCKPDSHKTLYEWVADFEREEKIEVMEKRRWTGKQYVVDRYRFMNKMPLRNSDDALLVNWCELETTDESGKVLYHNAFATNYTLDKNNVAKIVKAGRTRWKIENENNNTLKTKGYNFKHNFGHGSQYLASILASLIILAYLFHTVLEWFDVCYQLLREYLPSRKIFFDDLRALTRYMLFDDWQCLMEFMLDGLKIPIPISNKLMSVSLN
ncbi:Transposase DDE domain protein [Candidatus Venteria ishoeyi]|uniref:Transposase DDE domain protein n=3 Tax=Candidatus Venteria ishoeyi TaxID=1899563 RepID=A0A1H6FDH6_9GAMM|nr:Transposase DDE domain protein [Candidatus Venteria ishoeyi]